MNVLNELDSREKIIQAAITVFAEKGRYGARMEEIAAKAGINKAMLYYYFSTRENLHHEAVRQVLVGRMTTIYSRVSQIVDNSSLDTIEKLKQIVNVYFEVFSADQRYNKLMVDAVASDPQELHNLLRDIKATQQFNIPGKFLDFFQQGMAQQVFRQVDPLQLIVSLLSMTLFYFVGKPAISAMLNLQIEDEPAFLQQRQEALIDLLLFGIVADEYRMSKD